MMQRLLLPLSLMVSPFMASCGKKVGGPSGETVSTVRSGDLEGAVANSDLGKRLDQVDADIRGLLDEERLAREAGDRLLQKQINEIIADLAKLRTRLEADIAALKAEDEKLRSEIQSGLMDLKEDMLAKIQAGDEKIFQDLREMLRAVELKTDAQNAEIKLITDVLVALLKEGSTSENPQYYTLQELEELAAQRNIDVADLKAAKALAERERATMNQKVKDLEERQEAFEAYANATYAKKTELESLQVRVVGLEAMAQILDGRITNLDSRLTDEVKNLRDDMLLRIARVEASVESLKSEFESHLDEYHDQYKEIGTSVADAIGRFRADLSIVQTDIRVVRTNVTNLQTRVADLEAFRRMIGDFDTKLAQVQRSAVDEATRQAADEMKLKLDAMRAELTRDDAMLKQQLDGLTIQIARVREIAVESKQLAESNQRAIGSLETALENAKREFSAELKKLETDMTAELEKVRKDAIDTVKDLESDMQAKFAQMNVHMAEVQNKVVYGGQTIMHILSDLIASPSKYARYNPIFSAGAKSAAEAIFNYRTAQLRMEDEFIAAIDPVLSAKGVSIDAINLSFRTLITNGTCSGEPGIGGVTAVVRGKEWFYHLAREYSRMLVTEARSAQEWEHIYLGRSRIYTSNTNMRSLAVVAASEPYSLGTRGECVLAIQSWARQMLINDQTHSAKIRKAMVEYDPFRRAVAQLYTQSNALSAPMDEVLNQVVALLTEEFGSEALARQKLTVSTETKPSKLTDIIQLLMELAGDVETINDIRENRENIIGLAREVAGIKDAVNRNTLAITALNQRVTRLENQMRQVLEVIPQQVDRLTDAAKIGFNLIATIAARLGYQDVVAAAEAASRDLGGTISILPERIDGCYAAQHYFNHADMTKPDLPGARCLSEISVPGKILTTAAQSKCFVQGGSLARQYIVRTRSNTNSFQGLELKQIYGLGHARLRELMLMPANATAQQQNNESAVVLRVTGGSPDRFRINIRSVSAPTISPLDLIVNASSHLVSSPMGTSNWIYDIPLGQVFPLNDRGRSRDIQVTAIDSSNKEIGPTCIHRIRRVSPIVLDLSGTGMIETVNPLLSSTMFDLDGNGRKKRTGWITKGSGFLALDLNGNGKIDDGRELFGEGTRMADGSKAKHGYEALAQYDLNGDGKITSKDPIFDRLMVWQDLNQDGIAQPYETFSLKQLGITALSVKHKNVPEDIAYQHHGLPEANHLKYESLYWGPEACGSKGCKTFDVFFGSTESYSVSQTR
jgi:predicted  nucleic acid-binding Zn-ribbon protein